MTEHEITPEELKDIAGGKRTQRAGSVDGSVEGKQARTTRDGKTTIRRHAGPGN